MAEDKKAVHSIILDAGPLIANTPPISTLLRKAEQIFTTPSVIGEIKDATTRARLETLVIPFITLRTPNANSTKFVIEFAKKSGDFAVLSKTDIEIIALAYELELERNGGDWRLRKTPGQKTVNGPPARKLPEGASAQDEPATSDEDGAGAGPVKTIDSTISEGLETTNNISDTVSSSHDLIKAVEAIDGLAIGDGSIEESNGELSNILDQGEIFESGESSASNYTATQQPTCVETASEPTGLAVPSATIVTKSSMHVEGTHVPVSALSSSELSSDSDENSDGGKWITPSNIIRHKTSSQAGSTTSSAQAKTLQVATLTTDHALQNTLMLINLNLLSSTLTRIAHVRSHILRCHACFATTKQMEKQFCPRCGQPTLTRVSTSTNADGSTALHLKKNMQWNTRGNRYSIPKPVAGTSNGKMREKGGGKGGWGKDLILAEDQKEYVRAVRDQEREKRQNERDFLDQDFLPGIMSANRGHTPNGKIQIGAGRAVNSRKRK